MAHTVTATHCHSNILAQTHTQSHCNTLQHTCRRKQPDFWRKPTHNLNATHCNTPQNTATYAQTQATRFLAQDGTQYKAQSANPNGVIVHVEQSEKDLVHAIDEKFKLAPAGVGGWVGG